MALSRICTWLGVLGVLRAYGEGPGMEQGVSRSQMKERLGYHTWEFGFPSVGNDLFSFLKTFLNGKFQTCIKIVSIVHNTHKLNL